MSALKKIPIFSKSSTMRDELTDLIETSISEMESGFDINEGLLLRNMLGLRDITAEDVMVPRADIVSVDIADGFDSVMRQISEASHSRVPAYEGGVDSIVGMLHIKDLLLHLLQEKQPALSGLLRPVLFVSPSIRLLELLQEMRLKRQHLALVVDEYGGIDGLITIEDLVEEIVGEIQDEHDDDEAPHVEIAHDGSATANARLEISVLEDMFGDLLDESEREEVDTIGGLVFSLAGRVPVRGEVIRHPSGLEFEILDSDPRRISLIRISGIAPQQDRSETLPN
ncbi:MAG: HlyC/CorC family transporter [Alphaproteobacteria bacterium]|nr:HlyC/CorC family transporter [Alphaproteobacteria bacterium]MBT4848817.1 HlyC/CorC family transporter [Alphaproteobacteria bacterium]MBT5481345.1 HlyC/CorC family transporter [Alphaproteobacteria bacterium]MBT5728283.1 HlyC/CorC family transporter [Alphaproteobacteria bacterium]MBT7219446.1 HlyC/CorC family transporter [Alphaproteobacteria bacterium]